MCVGLYNVHVKLHEEAKNKKPCLENPRETVGLFRKFSGGHRNVSLKKILPSKQTNKLRTLQVLQPVPPENIFRISLNFHTEDFIIQGSVFQIRPKCTFFFSKKMLSLDESVPILKYLK